MKSIYEESGAKGTGDEIIIWTSCVALDEMATEESGPDISRVTRDTIFDLPATKEVGFKWGLLWS